VCCESQEEARQVRESLLPCWWAERGLTLAAEKTRLGHLTEGFDFLGCRVRHYAAPRTSRTGYKLLSTPSPRAVAATRQAWREIWRPLRGHSRKNILDRLTPSIRGWATSYRPVVASRTFYKMDPWMHRRVVQPVRRQHRHKPWRWCKQRYWGQLNPERNASWVFGEKHTGRYLLKCKWFKIVRHRLVRGTASPDDPRLRGEWQERRREESRYLRRSDVKLAYAQDGRCPVCGMDLMNGAALHCHHRQAKADGGWDAYQNLALVHLYCHPHQTRQWQRTRQATQEQLGKCRK
jgi:RNA-directed DNA polymerase